MAYTIMSAIMQDGQKYEDDDIKNGAIFNYVVGSPSFIEIDKGGYVESIDIIGTASGNRDELTQEVRISFDVERNGQIIKILGTNKPPQMLPTMGGRRGAAAAAAPKATAERVMVAGRKRVVYVGARGGRYIKKGEGYVSLRSLAA